MKIPADSVQDYLLNVPEERKEFFKNLYESIRNNLPNGFEETLSYGMIGWVVPHTLYPKGYHCKPNLPLPFLNLASQKNFVAVYHMGLYSNPELFAWFKEEYSKFNPKKIDMGKSCMRFKKSEDIPFELIEKLCQKINPEQWIATYEKMYLK